MAENGNPYLEPPDPNGKVPSFDGVLMIPAEKRKRCQNFLTLLSGNGILTRAAKDANLNYQYVKWLMEHDRVFAGMVDTAKAEAVDDLELEARRRAVHGVEEPVFHQGVVVGYKTRYSDRLLVTLLQAKKPDEFGSKVSHEHKGRIEHDHSAKVADALKLQDMPREDLEQLRAMALKMKHLQTNTIDAEFVEVHDESKS